MTSRLCSRVAIAAFALAAASSAFAAKVLVIYGPIHPPSNFVIPLQNAGHTVTTSQTVPADAELSLYEQVWDLRVTGATADDPGTAITPGQRAQYVAFLAAGKRIFVVGEYNSPNRDVSLLALVLDAGGGQLVQ